jgi:hypothetical protein
MSVLLASVSTSVHNANVVKNDSVKFEPYIVAVFKMASRSINYVAVTKSSCQVKVNYNA